MKSKKWFALALALVLMLCLLPASALADEEAQTLSNGEEDTVYIQTGDTVYNDGGVAYNNGGTVYNNGGVVYNNGGTVYNNGGVVYNNGGTAFNNDGTVYNNGGVVYSNGGLVEESSSDGTFRVNLAEDYRGKATLDGVTGDENGDGYIIEAGGVCTIAPEPGYIILQAESSAGELTENEDGTYTLENMDKSALLTLDLQLAAPEFSVVGGTYGSKFELELSAAAGAAIYFTTDGSEPTEEGELYGLPIAISEGTLVRAVAVADGAGSSNTVEASYAIPVLTAPGFDTEKEGYKQPAAKGVAIENPGGADAVITAVAIDGETPEAFLLSTTEGDTIPAGETDDTTWTVCPAAKLAKGAYSARLIFTFDSGEVASVMIGFKVGD